MSKQHRAVVQKQKSTQVRTRARTHLERGELPGHHLFYIYFAL